MTKTFLVVQTGVSESREVPCNCGCKQTFKNEREQWKRLDTGETTFDGAYSFGTGAMWFEEQWLSEGKHRDWDNDDGQHLVVRTPGGLWDIDSRASNCGSPNDRLHRCWIRHGIAPDITVDKVGLTCSAGAGSIISGKYHGFLRAGEFTPPL